MESDINCHRLTLRCRVIAAVHDPEPESVDFMAVFRAVVHTFV